LSCFAVKFLHIVTSCKLISHLTSSWYRNGSTLMPNSHRPPDAKRRSCPCRVWCAGVNYWTIALNVFRLHIFCRRQSCVVGNPIHSAETDASTQTGQFCRVWPGLTVWIEHYTPRSLPVNIVSQYVAVLHSRNAWYSSYKFISISSYWYEDVKWLSESSRL